MGFIWVSLLCVSLLFALEMPPSMAAESKTTITQAEALEDVRQFFSTIQRVHPDLLANMEDTGDYLKLKLRMPDDIAAKADKNGRISVRDLAYMLYYAAAFLNDGHTSVRWHYTPTESDTAGKRFPPFLFRYEDRGFVISNSGRTDIEGLEVIAIDGKPILNYLRPILDRCSGETLPFRASRFIGEQLFWYSFSDVLGSAPSLKLRLRDARGKVREQTLDTIDMAHFQGLGLLGQKDKLDALRQKGTAVYFLDSDRIAYFVYPGFNMTDSEKKKVDEIFEQIKAKGSRDLIIDLRRNGGGSSSMGDLIFSYLYSGKFGMFSKARVRLSRDVLSSVAKGFGIPESADIDGLVVTWTMKEQSAAKPKAFFSGRTFLLVDNGTFSSAVGFAATFRDYRAGTIIGSETGGVPNCFGDVYRFRLEHSGIECGVSWKQFFCAKPKPGDDEHGVLPDIPATRDALRAYLDQDDPVVAMTVDYIKKTRAAH